MKVKNGIASSVSFCMMPNMRKGSACRNAGWMMPSSMPMTPKNSPHAASENATA